MDTQDGIDIGKCSPDYVLKLENEIADLRQKLYKKNGECEWLQNKLKEQ